MLNLNEEEKKVWEAHRHSAKSLIQTYIALRDLLKPIIHTGPKYTPEEIQSALVEARGMIAEDDKALSGTTFYILDGESHCSPWAKKVCLLRENRQKLVEIIDEFMLP